MSSTSIVVKDFRTEVPGALSATRMSWEFPPIIASKRNSDKKLEWRICVRVVPAGAKTTDTTRIFKKIKDVYFDNKPMDGLWGWIKVFKRHMDNPTWDKTVPTFVSKGKNIGRKNQTNVFTQALRDAYGIYNKQLQRATETAPKQPWEAERFPPMLVQILGNQDIDYSNCYVQRKLDGIRTVATIEKCSGDADASDCVVLYSRTKKTFEGKQYIRDKLLSVLQHYRDTTGDIIYLDGEAYSHGQPLQVLSGEMRLSAGEENPNIRMEFCVFDLFIPAKPALTYVERKRILDEIFKDHGDTLAPEVQPVETFHTTSREQIDSLYEQFLEEEYEGAIVRLPNLSYEYSFKGYHSSHILKMKPHFDDEFEIVGYTSGRRGKSADSVMWKVKTEDNKEFDVTPMGTIQSREELYAKLGTVEANGRTVFENQYKGRKMTVVYDDTSIDGIPVRARAKVLRDYE